MSAALARFNALPAAEAERELLACCAAPAWARALAAGRPYADNAAAVTVADAALASLSWPEIAQALAAHPRIGERARGAGRDATWSRREQAGVAEADPAVQTALAEVNREYEQRFGHVFLVFATGRGPAEILAAARARLGHDEITERGVIRDELRKITRLRLERLLSA